MVLNRLRWRTGPLHQSIFAYAKRTGTAECLTSFLGELRNGKGMAVFLDLEKAFELACPAAILTALVKKGVGGRLLRWLADFLRGREACVRFQGHTSSYHGHTHGTPQGSILSPFLFNILMEGLLTLDYGRGVRLLCYADDLALVITRQNFYTKAQGALTLLHTKCQELGLKVNFTKTKAMVFGSPCVTRPLKFNEHPIECVTRHQYLGVWFDGMLTMSSHVRYLRDRTAARTRVLRGLSARGRGATHHVLRIFYVQAIRTLVDYCAPCLVALSSPLIDKLEVIQNNALRVMFRAPPWTKVSNLRLESGLIPLESRIGVRTANTIAKMARSTRAYAPVARVALAANLHPDLLGEGWVHRAAKVINKFGVAGVLREGADAPHPNYSLPPPWTPPPFHFHFPACPTKANTSPLILRLEGLREIALLTTPESVTYYTDGSVSTRGGAAGAAFVSDGRSESWRVSDGASSLQTELVAIGGAIGDAQHQPKAHIIIHTDSLSAIQALHHPEPADNVHLITSIYAKATAMVEEGRTLTLHWVPSHVGIAGNERADREAKLAASRPEVNFDIVQSLSQTKHNTRAQANILNRRAHEDAVAQGSPSAAWYARASRYEPLVPSGETSTEAFINFERLRLGYKCASQVIHGSPVLDCEHCQAREADPLLHYLLQCPVTASMRQQGMFYPSPEDPGAWESASQILADARVQTVMRIVKQNKPPR